MIRIEHTPSIISKPPPVPFQCLARGGVLTFPQGLGFCLWWGAFVFLGFWGFYVLRILVFLGVSVFGLLEVLGFYFCFLQSTTHVLTNN